MSNTHATIFTDGASRGNPGRAAVAYVIIRDGFDDIRASDTIGIATNNVAEYSAMIHALATAREIGVTSFRLHSDSELMVKQLRGEYRVKHPDIIPLYEEARELIDSFHRAEFVHIPRAQNAEADRLGNEALDGNPTTPVTDGHPAPAIEKKKGSTNQHPAEVLRFLANLRMSWSGGRGPGVEEVWAELEELLKRSKVLKTRRGKSAE